MTRQEPDVTLPRLSDEEYNADGSFEYPPIPRSVAQHVAFWSHVHVPDALLTRARAAYNENWIKWNNATLDAWELAHPHPTGKVWRSDNKEAQAWTARRDAEAARLYELRPEILPAVLVRPLIRAAQMSRYGREWMDSKEQYEELLDTEIDLGQVEPSTVRAALADYGLDELPPGAFEDATSYAGLNAAVATQRLTELVEILSSQDGDKQ